MLTVLIDVNSKEPMYEQIYKYIREEIKNGNISCGTKLPSGRGLATYLEVSRNTIDMAYGQLLSEGYIESIPKKGYYVCNLESLYIEEQIKKSGRREEKQLAEKRAKAREKQEEEYQIDFSISGVDMDYFPYGKWRKLKAH